MKLLKSTLSKLLKHKITPSSQKHFLQSIYKFSFSSETPIFNKDDSQKQAESVESKTQITNDLLCKLIGSKNYQINNEIRIDHNTIVKVFNENDTFLGDKVLKDVIEEAKEINKDVVLRNDKVIPPIVKVMKYKVELMKRLIKKVSRNKEYKLGETKSEKVISISYTIEENDLGNKISQCQDMLKYYSHLKILVSCDLKDKDQVYKANNILNHVVDELSSSGKLVKTIQEHRHETSIKDLFKEMGREGKPDELTERLEAINNEEYEKIKDDMIYKQNDVKLREDSLNQKDILSKDYLFIEVESLLVDVSGLDYGKMVEAVYIEDLFDGLKSQKFKGIEKEREESEKEEVEKERVGKVLTEEELNEKVLKKEERKIFSIEERLEKTKKTLDSEGDFFKRLTLSKNLKKLKIEMEERKQATFLKAIIQSNIKYELFKMKKNPDSFL